MLIRSLKKAFNVRYHSKIHDAVSVVSRSQPAIVTAPPPRKTVWAAASPIITLCYTTTIIMQSWYHTRNNRNLRTRYRQHHIRVQATSLTPCRWSLD